MSMRLRRYVRAVGALRIAAKTSGTPPSTLALGLEGFDELRRYIKQGCELCKEIAVIAAERSDLETFYSRGLQRLSVKLAKVCGAGTGTIAAAWGSVATEMQQESDAHRTIAVALLEDICKPLRILAETQTKDRKPIEQAVEKTTRDMVDRKAEESKFKQKMFTYTQESETSHEQIIQSRLNKEKEKEIAKMEKRLHVLKDHARKSGKQYYDACVAAELAREEWDSALQKGSRDLRDMEAERLKQLHKHLKMYKGQVESLAPVLAKVCEKLQQASDSVDFEKDLTTALEGRGYCLTATEQFLFETYAENMENSMPKERRRQTLNLYLYYLSQDIDKETKTKQGMERLLDIYSTKPTYSTVEAQEEVKAKLKQTCAFLNFLDASHFKLSCTLAAVNDQARPVYKHERHLEVEKDKMGLRQTVLRLPVDLVAEAFDPDLYSARGAGDGSTLTDHHYSLAHDEDYGSDVVVQGTATCKVDPENDTDAHDTDAHDDDAFNEDEFDSYYCTDKPIATCQAVYDYTSKNTSELTIKKGDTLQVYEKHSDGWWYGELSGKWGLFPASYVQEVHADEANHDVDGRSSSCGTSSVPASAEAGLAAEERLSHRSDAVGQEGSPRPAAAAAAAVAPDSASSPQKPPVAARPPRPAGSPAGRPLWNARTVHVQAAPAPTESPPPPPSSSPGAAAGFVKASPPESRRH